MSGVKADILYTKLQRPPIAPDIVPRKRLSDRVEEGRHLPLTLISAPAGYGKSTLASRWAELAGGPCTWLSLDEGDNDLRQFLGYFIAAIKKIFPKIQLKTEPLLEADRLPPEAEVARYLLNDLNQAPEPFTLVLDDYHCITQTAVNELIAQLLAYPSRTMRLILLTRKDPALPIATLRGGGLVTEIRICDLMFTPDEAAAFLHEMLGIDIDMETATLLDDKTEGWAVGLRLAGIYLQGEKNPKARVQLIVWCCCIPSSEKSANARHLPRLSPSKTP
jgi:LuxR family maltose regulon positive regulatory protein